MIRRVLLAFVLLLAGCSEPGGATEPQVEFTASIEPGTDALRISYRLRNKGSEPVVAYVGVPGEPVSHEWDVFVTAREDGTVEVAKRTFDIPQGTDADAVGTIEGLVIAPGAEFSEEFQVRLPLRERHPYRASSPLPSGAAEYVFCLGVVLEREAAQPLPAERGRGKYPLNGLQHLLCS